MTAKLTIFLFGEPVRLDLPARVAEQIRRRQDMAERLISWVQLLLVTLFSALWAVAQQVNMTNTPFQVVPVALSAYFLFTMARLILSYRMSLPNWFLILSILIDVALLMAMIWSFHIQYGQPASFYLKAPTLMYVFIFIALRALRFEHLHLLTAGLAAATGWGLLMTYVMIAEAGNPMITRDYVAYMTSNAILIGAEIDKIVSILLVTAVLCVAIERARRSFYRAVLEQTAAEDLSRFVSKEVAERITHADAQIQPGDGEARFASVIFTDIESFATVSEKMNAQELASTLNAYFGAMGEIVAQFGGVITHFEGDLMLITFNAVTNDPDHALNAVRCAQLIERTARSQSFNGATLKTRCGVNTGEMSIGAVGAQDRLTFTVHGDSVNVAARLEQLNKQHGTYVMLGEETAKLVNGEVPCRFVTETTVKSRAQPVKVYTLA